MPAQSKNKHHSKPMNFYWLVRVHHKLHPSVSMANLDHLFVNLADSVRKDARNDQTIPI